VIDLLLLLAQAPQDLGAKVFATSCAVGYCHGADGTANRGPRLRDRNFERSHVEKAIRNGIPNSAMPGFQDRLEKGDLEAVIAYVIRISGAKGEAASPTPSPAPRSQSRGEALAFDSSREMRCAACHEFEGKGTKMAPLVKGVVKRVTLRAGESFPGLIASDAGGTMRIYDLTAPPPVLRTITKDEVASIAPETKWRHTDVTKEYTAAELDEITRYLRQ
jgi:mono/diheme cytochrome c family protein